LSRTGAISKEDSLLKVSRTSNSPVKAGSWQEVQSAFFNQKHSGESRAQLKWELLERKPFLQKGDEIWLRKY